MDLTKVRPMVFVSSSKTSFRLFLEYSGNRYPLVSRSSMAISARRPFANAIFTIDLPPPDSEGQEPLDQLVNLRLLKG